jgi:hypothetical protein
VLAGPGLTAGKFRPRDGKFESPGLLVPGDGDKTSRIPGVVCSTPLADQATMIDRQLISQGVVAIRVNKERHPVNSGLRFVKSPAGSRHGSLTGPVTSEQAGGEVKVFAVSGNHCE